MRIMQKRVKSNSKILTIVQKLAYNLLIPPNCRDLVLSCDYAGCRECHIEPDWSLVYKLEGENILKLVETGTHSDFF